MTIRVAVVSDQPFMRAGVLELLGRARGLSGVVAAPAAPALWPLVRGARPGVVVVGCGESPRDALRVCRVAKVDAPAPRVLAAVRSTEAADVLPALVAGADGVVHDAVSPERLLAAIHAVAAGERVVPRLSPAALGTVAGRVDSGDLPILGMALNGVAASDIAAVVGVEPRQLARRIDGMLARLCELSP